VGEDEVWVRTYCIDLPAMDLADGFAATAVVSPAVASRRRARYKETTARSDSAFHQPEEQKHYRKIQTMN
jgi:hypothetical protein